MQPRDEHAIAIVGAGTIGIGLAIALRARGLQKVYALDKLEDKLAMIQKFGASPIHVGQEDAIARVRDATEGRMADGVFEAVGAAATVRTAYELCARGGTIVLIGNLAHEFTLPLQGVTGNETTIRGSYGFTKQDFAEAVSLVADKSLALDQLITGSCSLEETPDVMTKLAREELSAIKMVIRP
jgi:L-iditol 2-dehydrogenase